MKTLLGPTRPRIRIQFSRSPNRKPSRRFRRSRSHRVHMLRMEKPLGPICLRTHIPRSRSPSREPLRRVLRMRPRGRPLRRQQLRRGLPTHGRPKISQGRMWSSLPRTNRCNLSRGLPRRLHTTIPARSPATNSLLNRSTKARANRKRPEEPFHGVGDI